MLVEEKPLLFMVIPTMGDGKKTIYFLCIYTCVCNAARKWKIIFTFSEAFKYGKKCLVL